MRKIIICLLILFFIYPNNILANITCNDGTSSPSCSDCHQGCCSHHGGCLKNNHYDNKNISKRSNYEEDDSQNDYSYLIGLGGAAACGYFIGKKKENLK